MPSQDPIQLTPAIQVASASPFHTVSLVPVLIDCNPDNKEIYKQGGSFVNDEWVQYYALTKTALEKLMNAAGIEEVSNQRTDDRSHPYVCSWTFKGRWTQPDSTKIEVSGDYELDLRDWIEIPDRSRIRGARFEQLMLAERDDLLSKTYGTSLKGLRGDPKKIKLDEIYSSLPDTDKEKVTALAEGLALRAIIAMRPHIHSRAQTGAQDRFIRKILNLKSTYTLDELKRGFVVPRSRFDYERMIQVLGPEAKNLMLAQAAEILGVNSDRIAEMRQISQPESGNGSSSIVIHPIVEGAKETTDHGILEYSGDNNQLVKVNGAWKPTGQTVAESGKVTEKTLKPFLDLFDGNKFHLDGHLKKHFGVGAVASLTWEQVAALLACMRDKNYDYRWYADRIREQKHDTGFVIDAGVAKTYGLDPFSVPGDEISPEHRFLKNMALLTDPRCLVGPMEKRKLVFDKHAQELADLSELLRLGTVAPGTDAFEEIMDGMNEVPF